AEGETLSEIANRFDLSYEILASYNELADPDTLLPGQRILVPSIDAIADLGG
ncbi:MAG: LysM peptidoglycan-binding domain-containing protein, partial [Spirochaetaceae bacterium]|nr:LysM peptidoglycan-binding domain-containing protein [Spirochaetaceae bacterium]